MSQTIDRPELSPAEWKLIQDLRSLPDAALRDRMQTSIGELLFFFRTPRCQGIGIEGFQDIKEGDVIFFVSDKAAVASRIAGDLRSKLSGHGGLVNTLE